MNPLTEAREAVAAALAGLSVTIYGAPPEVATPPAAVVLPSGTWYAQKTLSAVEVTFAVTLMATTSGTNAAALERLEQLLWDSTEALSKIAVVGTADNPRLLKVGTAEVAACDVTVQVLVDTAEGEPQP